jgi:hypothetical protein
MTSNTIGLCNTAVGLDALMNNVTGSNNTAIGCNTLMTNTIASDCTVIGYNALAQNQGMSSENIALGSGSLAQNIEGWGNIAIGFDALSTNTSGSNNIAIGVDALSINMTGSYNVAVGNGALAYTSGQFNTAIGLGRVGQNLTGSSNTFIGINAGTGLTGDESGVICIGATGISGISDATYIESIYGTDLSVFDSSEVMVSPGNLLGTIYDPGMSLFKDNTENITDKEQEKLLNLRPVCCICKNGEKYKKKYGLCIQEVEQVFPELVAFDNNGRPNHILYQYLWPLLLAEFKKQHIHVQQQQLAIIQRQETMERLRVEFEAFKSTLSH